MFEYGWDCESTWIPIYLRLFIYGFIYAYIFTGSKLWDIYSRIRVDVSFHDMTMYELLFEQTESS